MCRRSLAQWRLDRTGFPEICLHAAKSEMRSKMHINSQSSDQRWRPRGLHRRRSLFSHGRTRTRNPFAPRTELPLSRKCVLAEVGWRTDCNWFNSPRLCVCRRVYASIHFMFSCFYWTQHVNLEVEGRKSQKKYVNCSAKDFSKSSSEPGVKRPGEWRDWRCW